MQLWYSAATRDITPVQQGGTFGLGGPKIVLLTVEGLAKPTYQINGGTPHFTMDTRPNGRMFQHIPLSKSGYALDSIANEDPNKTGFVIEVMLYGHSAYAHDWSAEQLRRLGILLAWIAEQIGAPKTFPYPFVGPNAAAAGDVRLSWDNWVAAKGILGHQHAPYNHPDGVGPGRLNTTLLKTMLGPGNLPPGGSVSVGGGGGQPDRTADAAGTLEGEEESEDTSGVSAVEDVDISRKNFRFNPVLHRDNMSQRVDYASPDPGDTLSAWYDEVGVKKKWNEADVGEIGRKFNQFRLGRIIQDRTAVGYAAEAKFRYGFRFLYNPATVSIGATRNDSFVIDPQSAVNMVISGMNQNFQNVGLELLLDRVPDVMNPGISNADYAPNLNAGDRKGLREQGTHWDLEYLYRVCNGIWDVKDRGRTADIGVIIPANVRLILGRGQNYFGFLSSISYEDLLFSPDMVPIRTKVQINFRRHVDISPGADAEAFQARFSAIEGSLDGDDDSTSSSSTSASGTSGGDRSGQTLSSRARGKNEYDIITTITGQKLAARLYALLENVEADLGIDIIPYITQGSYSTRIVASGGTHAGGGAVDLINNAWGTGAQMTKILKVMRQWGLIAWHRTPSQGFVHHIHGIDKGANDLSPQAKIQVQNWKDGLNGLRGTNPDDGPNVPVPDFKYPY